MPTGDVHRLLRVLASPVLTGCLAVVLIVAAPGCGGSGGAGATPAAAPAGGAAVVARVDGVAVTRADVSAVRAQARLEGRRLTWAQARERGVRLVLVRRAAARAGLKVSDGAANAALAALVKRSGGEAALASALDAVGLSRARLRTALADEMLEGRLSDALFPHLRATTGATRAFYRRNTNALFKSAAQMRLGKITVPGEQIARKIAARLAAGADFAATAQRYSMDPETRTQGGLLGWVSVLTLPPEVGKALAGLRAGDVTGPVRSFGRWQLFKLYARRPASVTPFSDVEVAIRRELTRRRRAAALDKWLARARARAKVEILP